MMLSLNLLEVNMNEPLCVISLPEKQVEVFPGKDANHLLLLVYKEGQATFPVEISKRLLPDYLAL